MHPARPARTGHRLPGQPRWLQRCAGACLWTCTAAVAACVLLGLFIVAIEPADVVADLPSRMATPLNVARVVVLTACLALWGYILREAGMVGRRRAGA